MDVLRQLAAQSAEQIATLQATIGTDSSGSLKKNPELQRRQVLGFDFAQQEQVHVHPLRVRTCLWRPSRWSARRRVGGSTSNVAKGELEGESHAGVERRCSLEVIACSCARCGQWTRWHAS